MAKRRRIFVLNDPYALRVSPELAAEIGLNESIVLLQLEFLISISDNERDGRTWVYASLDELRRLYFPWWSRATIARTLKALADASYIDIGNYNRAGFDKTQWFALDYDGIAKLQSLRIDTPVSQNETWTSHSRTSVSHRETRTSQNGTTIPETTSETTQREDGPTSLDELLERSKKLEEQRRWIALGKRIQDKK